MAGTLSHGFARVGRWLHKEFITLRPVFVFFLVGFILLISLIKLALRQYSIELTILSKAIIGALLAAKAAMVVDETPLAHTLDQYPRIVDVTIKVGLYASTCLLLLYVERLFEAWHALHNFHGALQYVIEHETRYLVLLWLLGISILFTLYFAFVEINERMGEGELWRLFFESRTTGDDPRPASNPGAAGRRN